MRNLGRLLVIALVATTFVLSGDPAGATTAGFTDTLNESGVNDPRGDIEWIGATYSADGFVGLGMATVVQDSLSSPNWVNGAVALNWEIATPTGTYDAWFFEADRGVVKNSAFQDVCTFTPDTTDSGVYFAGFPGSCIGSPSVFQVRGYISYDDDWGAHTSSYDFGPNSGFCCAVSPGGSMEPPPTTTTTTQPPTTTTTTRPADPPVTTATVKSGYAMVTSDGDIHNFGDAPYCGNSPGWDDRDTVDIDATPNGQGYWVLQSHGFVHFLDCGMSTRDYLDYETVNSLSLNTGEKAVSLSARPDGKGYWVFTDRGRALNFGTAKHLGDMGGVRLNAPILDSVATPTGEGYWMVAADGGIFTFGDAAFAGSTGAIKLNKPVMSMAADPDGSGYWLVASDGGIFAFDAPFFGSMGATKLNKPVSGMVPGSAGYMMVAEDGGIFSFGNVAFHGSLGANPPPYPVVAVSLLD